MPRAPWTPSSEALRMARPTNTARSFRQQAQPVLGRIVREVPIMESFYRTLVPIALWLGIAAFVLAVVMMLVGHPFLFNVTAGGILRSAQTLFLAAVGSYCASRLTQRS